MATTITIACPECQKEIKAPAEILGKKIRCKSCGHVFAAKPAPGTGVKPPSGNTAPKAVKKPRLAERVADDEDDSNPYAVTDMSFAPRCPHCANEMESEDAIICLVCGYNTQTRTSPGTRKVLETTGMDYFLWLTPGILAALATILLLAYPPVHYFAMPGWIWDNWDQVLADNADSHAKAISDDKIQGWYAYFFHPGLAIWIAVGCVALAYRAGKFAIKRLIFNPHPPEVEKKR
jgi:hypothetical protein